LNLFCEVSGQKVSVHKTQTRDFRKYLGVPVLHRRITEQTYNYIIESMQQKLATWKAKNLSLAGRITLCKSVRTCCSSSVSNAIRSSTEIHLQRNRKKLSMIYMGR